MTAEQMVALMRQAYEALYFVRTGEVLHFEKAHKPIDKDGISAFNLICAAHDALWSALQAHDIETSAQKKAAEAAWTPDRQIKDVNGARAVVWQQKPWRWKLEWAGRIEKQGWADTEVEAKAAALAAAGDSE